MNGHSLSRGLALWVLLVTALIVLAWAPAVWADGSAAADGAAVVEADREPVRARRLFVPTNLAGPRAGGDKADPTFPFALGDLPSQGTLTVTYEVEVDPAATWVNTPVTQICNQATLASTNHGSVVTDDPDTGAAGDTTCTPVDAADLSVTKSEDVDPVAAGGTLVYTITVSNAGPQPASGVTVTDTLPAGVSLVSTSGCAEDPAAVPTCTLGTIAAMGMAQYTVTVTVGAGVADGTMLTNSVGVSSLTSESNPGDETASAVTTVQASADLTITKTDDVDPVNVGSNLVYTIEVSNSGPSDALGVVVTDTLPGDVTFVSTSGCAEDPNSAPGGVVTCTLGTVAAAGSEQFTLTVSVDPAAMGPLTNNASVTASTTLVNTGDDSTSEDTAVNAEASLRLTKGDAPDPVVAGEDPTYTLSVENLGPGTALDVEVCDLLPPGTVFDGVASDPSCSQPMDLTGLRALLDPANEVPPVASAATGSASFVLDTTTNELKYAIHVANIDNLTAAHIHSGAAGVNGPVVQNLWLGAPPPFGPLDPIAGTIQLTAMEAADLLANPHYVNVHTSDFPGGEIRGQIVVTAETPVRCAVGTVNASTTTPVSIVATVAASVPTGTVLTNVGMVQSSTLDPNRVALAAPNGSGILRGDTALTTTTVGTSADLSISKSDSVDPVIAGTNLVYTVTVNNAGPSDAQDVVVTDTLPAGVSLVSTSGCAEDPAGMPTCTLGTVAAGGSAMFTVTVAVAPGTTGTLTNSVSVASTTPEENPGDESTSEDTAVATQADLSITKVDDVDPADAGSALVYTIDVSNAGPSDAVGVVVTDTLPAEATFVSTTGCAEDPNSAPGGIVTCTLGTIASGGSDSFTLSVTIDPGAMGTITNNAAVTASTPLVNTGDDNTSESTAVTPVASLQLTKSDTPDPVVAGEDLGYTLSVENLGPGNAQNVTVCDLLPDGAVFDSVASDPSCSQPGDLTGLRALLDPANEVPPVASLASGSASFVLDTTTNELKFALHVANIDNLVAAHIHAGAAGVNGPVVQFLYNGTPPPFGPLDPITGTIQLTAMEAADLLANPHYVNVHTSDFPGGEIRGQIVPATEGPVRCDLGTVNASSTTPVDIVATVAASVPTGAVLANVGMVQSTTSDPAVVALPAPNGTGLLRGDTALTTTTVATSADLSITKTDSVDPVTAGTNLVYTITVSNAGPSDAQDVVVTDTLPVGTSLVSTSGCAEDPAGVPTCTLGTVAAGGSAMFTVTVAVAPGTTGTLTNSVSVASSTPEENPGDESTTEDTAVTTLADLSVTKADDTDPVVAGENVTYTITVSNAGPSDAVGVVATETLPAGTSLVSTSGCAEDPSAVPTCTLGTIVAGGMAQYQVTVAVDADVAAGTILTNMVQVAASTPLTNTGDDSTTETTTVAAEADLTITKVDDVDPVVAGQNITYTIEVSNNGPSDAQDVVVTDTLPTGTSLVSTSGCVEDPSGVPTCTLGTIAAGASVQAMITVSVDADVADGSTLTNTASVSASTTLTNTGDDSTTEDTLVATEADLTITKIDDVDPVVAGTNLVYTIEVSNAGPSDAQGVVVTDNLPAGVTFVSSTGCTEDPSGVPTCTLGTVAAGASAQAMVTVTVGSGTTGSITNNASVAATTTLINTGDDSTSETTTVDTEADLSIVKVDSVDPVNAGQPLSYTLTVSNAGPSDAVGVEVTDTLPAGVTFVSTSGCAEDPGGVPTCTLGTIPAGQSANYTVDVTVDDSTLGLITNTATVSATTNDPVPGNDTTTEDTTVEPTADLAIDKIDSEDPVANPTFTYTLEVTNNGPSEATGVEATDTLPSGIVFDSSADGCTELAGVVTCPFGTIANGATVSRSFVVALDPPFPAILSNTATVSGNEPDMDPSNDSDTEETTLDVVPPEVTALTTDYEAGDDVLDECETLTRVGVRAFEVTFSESVFDPAGDSDPDDVTNPDNFVIVAPGPDRDFQTTVCGPPVGDDVAIGVDAVIYDDGTQSAEVDLSAGLADDLYKLLICGSTSIVDQAGNSLDGDGDGTGGDDFERNFRLDVDNRFANGHFDCDLAEWDVLVTNAAELTHSTEDYEGADSSGSARFENLTASGLFQLSQCLDLPAIRGYEISGFARVSTPTPDEVAIGRFCEPFDGPACGGASLGEIASVVAGGTPDVWSPFGRTFDMPAAAQSARCGVRVTTGTGADFVVLFDALTFRNLDGAFSDGFESGDVSAWSDSEP